MFRSFLNTGVICAYFHFSGIIPELKLNLKMKLNGKAMTSAVSFNILGWMLSGPGDFDAFKDFNVFKTNSSVMLISVISVNLLKGGLNFALRRVIPHSPMILLEISFQPIKRHYINSTCCCIQKWLMGSRVLTAAMDLICLYRRK